jgi:hypothetical protein
MMMRSEKKISGSRAFLHEDDDASGESLRVSVSESAEKNPAMFHFLRLKLEESPLL